MLTDKNAVMQVFGSLMRQPSLLAESDKVSLTPDDFDTLFERYIFTAIYNLYQNGATKITVVDIDNYLSGHAGASQIFEKNHGIEYLQDTEDLCQFEAFSYYYNKLKKLNLLKELKKAGFKIDHIYSEDLLLDKNKEINEKFESYTVDDIINLVKRDLGKVEERFNVNAATTTGSAIDGLEDLVEKLKIAPEIGARLQGEIFNTIVRGARKGKYYIRSSATNTGKTRSAVGDACYIAYPIRFNPEIMKWEFNGDCEKVLFIATEQSKDEIQTMILAYISAVNEEKILYGHYSIEEEERIRKAIYVMGQYKDNFTIAEMPDPSISQVKSLIRGKYLTEGIENVFYDYIFSSPSLLNEFRDLKIREDVILMMFSTALKELAKELNIFVMSSTQVSGDLEGKKSGIKNQQYIRSAKSIADKADVGYITTEVTQEELNLLAAIISEYGIKPNQVTDIYKLRRGRWKNVRVWSLVDLGVCRREDLFITDGNFCALNDFDTIHFVFDIGNMDKVDKLVDLLNSKEEISSYSKDAPKIIDINIVQKIDVRDEDAGKMGWDNLL